MSCRPIAAVMLSTLFFLIGGTSPAGESASLNVVFEENVPVPMRDGVILRANVHRPDRGGPYPVLVMRTPYGKGGAGRFDRFVKAGYIVVAQDARGRYASDGQWESFVRFHTHDAEDGFDTVQWAAGLPGSNGRVGTMGASYNAFLQWRTAPLRPPALVAMAAFSIPARYLDLEGPGTIRPGRRLHWWTVSMAPDMRRRAKRPGTHSRAEMQKRWLAGESKKWLSFLPYLDLPRNIFEGETEPVKNWLRQPSTDPWKLHEGVKQITVPNLDIIGWYDHCNGDLLLNRTMQHEAASATARRGSRTIVGPWSHVGRGSRRYGNIDFGPNAVIDATAIQIRWFDYWLKNKGVVSQPAPRHQGKGLSNDSSHGSDSTKQGEADWIGPDWSYLLTGQPAPKPTPETHAAYRIFVMGENRWRHEPDWPLSRARNKVLHLVSAGQANRPTGDGRLVAERPSAPGEDHYTYDPQDPVPSLFGTPLFQIPTDRRPLAEREDILVYQTDVLSKRVEVTGNPVVELYASSSAPDTDFFVRLIDVAPDGVARDVSSGMVRARYRHGLDQPRLLTPGAVVHYTIRMSPTSNAFLPGHRIRLDITSSDFPNYDRNHNTAADQNADATLEIAQQTIYHGGKQATRVILPWIPESAVP